MSTQTTTLPMTERRRLGRYYTSDDVADYMARSAIVPHLLARCGWPGDPWRLITDNSDPLSVLIGWLTSTTDRERPRRFRDVVHSLTILDPTCGSGAFLLATQRVLQRLYQAVLGTNYCFARNLFGVDVCPAAVRACRKAIPHATILVGNALLDDTSFAWKRAFPAVLGRGGFDIILGNPPYLELREVPYQPAGFSLQSTGAVHALVIEQALRLLHPAGAMSMIVPLSLVSTQRMKPVQEMLEADHSVWYANFSWRPAKLFADVNRALTIVTAAPGKQTWTTGYQQWRSRDRATLMKGIRYTEVPRPHLTSWVPKLSCDLERDLLARWLTMPTRLGDLLTPQESGDGRDVVNGRIYYRCDGGLYWKVFTDFAPAFSVGGREGTSTRLTWLRVQRSEWILPLIGALSSDLFWWWYVVSSNCRHLNPSDLHGFPLPGSVLADEGIRRAARAYLDDIVRHSRIKSRRQRQTGHTQTQSFVIRRSRPLIEKLDDLLAPHYGLIAAELHFVKNYDLAFRLALPLEDR